MSNGGGVVIVGVEGLLGDEGGGGDDCRDVWFEDSSDPTGVLRLIVSRLGSFLTSGFTAGGGRVEDEAIGDAGLETRRCSSRSETSARVRSRIGEPVDRVGVGIRLGMWLWGCEVGREAGRDPKFLPAAAAVRRRGGRSGSRGGGVGGFAMCARINSRCSAVGRTRGRMNSSYSSVMNVQFQLGHGCSAQTVHSPRSLYACSCWTSSG